MLTGCKCSICKKWHSHVVLRQGKYVCVNCAYSKQKACFGTKEYSPISQICGSCGDRVKEEEQNGNKNI